MNGEFTQQQPLDEQLEAERLSLQATAPPAEIPGYRIEKFLGSGAFGQVWVGRDLNTGRRVAIKFYLHRGGIDWQLLAREVKHLVQLSADRNIVQVLDVGWDANPPYYVMEYLAQGSLEDLLRARGRLPVGQCIELFRGICVGLNYSHGKGVLHCDLKPANVLLDEEYRPRLADFGQSRMSHEQTPALGTLFYMAPEQANLESSPDVRWDVYALGAILYRMLTGNAPHRSSELLKKIDTAASLPKRLEQYREAILRDGPPRDHHSRRGVDRLLASIIDHCLAVDPGQRYANVQQVLEALDRRQLAKQRRPLVLLGIVGPLLLLLTTCIFTTRTIYETREKVAVALREKAAESNRLAAMFAARTMELELRKYFDLVQGEADQAPVRELLAKALADPELAALRQRIADSADVTTARDELVRAESLVPLENYLRDRLARYDGGAGASSTIDVASMFIMDAQGTIMTICYDTPVAPSENSEGKNFAYRAYFHGGREDLDRTTPVDSIRPITTPHLSSAFFSTATQTWKVAVSTPIYLQADHLPEDPPDAVFVATTDLGGFELMRSDAGQTPKRNQIAVLVDNRAGDKRGTIIQHPLLNPSTNATSNAPELLPNRSPLKAPAVDGSTLDALLAGSDVDFLDPMGEEPGGDDFRGLWTAAVQPVSLSALERSSTSTTTDLLVLVQYRWSDVVAPVGQLITTLMKYGAATVAGILTVIFLLWYFVKRVGDESHPAGVIGDEETRTGETLTQSFR